MRAVLLLGLAVLLASGPARAAKLRPPDSTFNRTISGVKYHCGEWGAPPKQFLIICVPVKHTAKGAA